MTGQTNLWKRLSETEEAQIIRENSGDNADA
jgi:hypothetical protein